MSLVQVLLLVAMGAGGVLAVVRRGAGLGATIAACAGIALVVTIVAWSHGLRDHVQTADGESIELTPAEAHGRELFAANCSRCHALRAANAVSQVGPNLDFLRPPATVVRRRIDEGSATTIAVMPADVVTGSDATDVASFVARVAGR